MVRKYAYCPRLFFLEWVHGEWADTGDTIEGQLVHRRVDRESAEFPSPEELGEGERLTARSVVLSAPVLDVVARIDLVEAADGTVRPVDYKKGKPGPIGPWDPEVMQLCAQGLVLQENGYRCDSGILYYAGIRRRVEVPFDDQLVTRTRQAILDMRRIASEPLPPAPLVDSPKCPRCSLVGICLPDETAFLRGDSRGLVNGCVNVLRRRPPFP
jgi:CRISPR-associated protein Cas4